MLFLFIEILNISSFPEILTNDGSFTHHLIEIMLVVVCLPNRDMVRINEDLGATLILSPNKVILWDIEN